MAVILLSVVSQRSTDKEQRLQSRIFTFPLEQIETLCFLVGSSQILSPVLIGSLATFLAVISPNLIELLGTACKKFAF